MIEWGITSYDGYASYWCNCGCCVGTFDSGFKEETG